MSKLRQWLKKSLDVVVDPEREQRVEALTQAVQRDMAQKKKAFNAFETFQRYQIAPQDQTLIKERIYERMLAKAWNDLQLTNSEQEFLNWVATSLQIPPARVSELYWGMGQDIFGRTLGAAFDDGVLDDHEVQQLGIIAQSMGTDVHGMLRQYFKNEGERFLKGMFLAATQDRQLTQDGWDRLMKATRDLGFSQQELMSVVQPQAQQFISHVLTDASADVRLQPDEATLLNWLLGNFHPSVQFRRYVEEEMTRLKLLTDIADGRLPSYDPPSNILLKAGEIVHYYAPTNYSYVRHLKSGNRLEMHNGMSVITDSRLIFDSATEAFSLNLRRILSHRWLKHSVELRPQGKKGAGVYDFGEHTQMAGEILRVAIGRANQTITEKVEDRPSRHISREVRQRVWQRYGGKCADCSADDYLEYDHIIPHAKGGSNSENNVQLLCRRCNLKKSDNI